MATAVLTISVMNILHDEGRTASLYIDYIKGKKEGKSIPVTGREGP
jgi:hypothetical protein